MEKCKKGHVPNNETQKAIEDARNGKVKPIENLDEWFDELEDEKPPSQG